MCEGPRCCDEAANHSYPELQPLNHENSFLEGMLKLNRKLDADLLLYLLSHF